MKRHLSSFYWGPPCYYCVYISGPAAECGPRLTTAVMAPCRGGHCAPCVAGRFTNVAIFVGECDRRWADCAVLKFWAFGSVWMKLELFRRWKAIDSIDDLGSILRFEMIFGVGCGGKFWIGVIGLWKENIDVKERLVKINWSCSNV